MATLTFFDGLLEIEPSPEGTFADHYPVVIYPLPSAPETELSVTPSKEA